ncbi:MAG TPA: efflux RND transporter periplasmic adaptor subunit, partial [Gemmataceae bacterium]|nr:efflux RND transporter periplasmic adaptor subunit [Gemmataceae bacterium]
TRRRFTMAATGALVILLTVAAAWVWAHEGHKPLPTKGVDTSEVAQGRLTVSRESREALDVQTAEVVSRSLPEAVLAYASLIAPWQQHAFGSSRLPGRIVKVHVKPGQAVEAGQLVAEVQSVELESLHLELLNAQNDVRLSEQLLQGLQESGGGIAKQQVLDAQTKYRQERNGLEVAQGKWLSLGLRQESLAAFLKEGKAKRVRALPILSPIRGTVIHADLTVGQVVGASEHLFEVVDLSKVWAKIGVLEQDLHRIAVGQEIELRVTAYPGKVFHSTVQVKGLDLDAQTHLNTVWAEFTTPTGEETHLLPGMSGQVRILLPGAASAKTIPMDALIEDGLDRYVLVEETGAAGASQYRKKSVVVRRRSPEWVAVESADLFPGDRVVTRGGHELAGFFVPGVLRLSPETVRTIGLRTEPVGPLAVEEVVELDGVVDVPPGRRTFASTLLAGTVQAIRIDRGQAVRAGDVIAEVASLELQSLQLDLLKEHLTCQLLEEQSRQYRGIETIVARRKVLELESALEASRNRRDSLRQRLEVVGLTTAQLDELLAKKKLAQALPVRAPISGIVVNFDKVLGQAVRAEEALAEIHDLSRPWVQAFVPEAELARVRIGQKARVRFVSDPNAALAGTVVRSGRVFGPQDRTLSVWVELERFPEQPLRHNQMARVTLAVRQFPPALAVPLAALVREGTQAFVFVRKADGTFDRRAVEMGRADDRRVEITRGLQPGEVVAVQGTSELQTAYASLR